MKRAQSDLAREDAQRDGLVEMAYEVRARFCDRALYVGRRLGARGTTPLAGAIAGAFRLSRGQEERDVRRQRPPRRTGRTAIDPRGADGVHEPAVERPVATLDRAPGDAV